MIKIPSAPGKRCMNLKKKLPPEVQWIYGNPSGDVEKDELPVFFGDYFSFKDAIDKTARQWL